MKLIQIVVLHVIMINKLYLKKSEIWSEWLSKIILRGYPNARVEKAYRGHKARVDSPQGEHPKGTEGGERGKGRPHGNVAA